MEFCADPSLLSGWRWFACYLSTPKHQLFYFSFLTVFALLAITAPLILAMGFAGAVARQSAFAPLRWFGNLYTSMVRGIPDVIFFLFVPIALDQIVEFTRHKIKCPELTERVYRGTEFIVCTQAKMPLQHAAEWVHQGWGFILAVVAFAVVFGAFAANTLYGALNAVPKNQIETASAYGFTEKQTFWKIQVPQMWAYALPGLSNLWMILVKATPLLFLLGIEDIVYWARELGGSKTRYFDYPHPDWRLWYFLALLVFYLCLTWVSGKVFDAIGSRVNRQNLNSSELTTGLGR